MTELLILIQGPICSGKTGAAEIIRKALAEAGVIVRVTDTPSETMIDPDSAPNRVHGKHAHILVSSTGRK